MNLSHKPNTVLKMVKTHITEPKITYYWGKVLKIFFSEKEGDVLDVEVSFLKKKTISSNPKEKEQQVTFQLFQ